MLSGIKLASVKSKILLPVIFIALVFIAIILLVKVMLQCSKWPRLVLLILFLLEIIAIAVHPTMISGTVQITLAVIGILLQVLAMIFLFNKSSNTWFNKE